MKRILLITESLGSGGAERQLCGLAAMLTAKGYQCRLITYAKGDFYEQYLKDCHVEYEYLPTLLNKDTRIVRLLKYLRQYRPTTVISFLPSVNMTCCLARMFYKCNLIVSERNNNTSVGRGDKVLFNLYRAADHIVPNSHSQGDFIKKNFPFLSKKVTPIINFVDVNKFTPTESKESNRTLNLVTVARYGYQKNCLLFLDAVRKVKDLGLPVRFQWFGSKRYDAKYAAEVEQKVNELDIADYISINEANPNIVEEYRKADAFILPSLYEGYPNVVAEAMSCELPILCGRVFENPYIVQEGENGFLFDPSNVDEIVESIKKMLSLSHDERMNMGRVNRKLCLKRNTEEIFFNNYLRLIQ